MVCLSSDCDASYLITKCSNCGPVHDFFGLWQPRTLGLGADLVSHQELGHARAKPGQLVKTRDWSTTASSVNPIPIPFGSTCPCL